MTSPGAVIAWARLASPSFEPSVAMISVSGSSFTPKRLVIGGLGAAQPGNAAGGRIAVGLRVPDRLDQLVDHRLGCGLVRIAHAEIDDVAAFRPRCCLHRIDFAENIRRQAPDAMELRLAHGGSSPGQ